MPDAGAGGEGGGPEQVSVFSLEEHLHRESKSWWLYLLQGIITIVIGIVVLALPGVSLFAFAMILGIALIVFGVTRLTGSWSKRGDAPGGWFPVFQGVVSTIAGILAIALPEITLVALAIVIGINFLIFGVAAIAGSIARRRDIDHWWIFLVQGILALLAGLIAIFVPGVTLLALALIFGIDLILLGALEIYISIKLRGLRREA